MDDDDFISTIKKRRALLESRIESQRKIQSDILASLQTQFPDDVFSMNLSLQIISAFNGRPFTRTPPPLTSSSTDPSSSFNGERFSNLSHGRREENQETKRTTLKRKKSAPEVGADSSGLTRSNPMKHCSSSLTKQRSSHRWSFPKYVHRQLDEPQWIKCDIRSFKLEILGHFSVVMADPPWDINMKLPYPTMADEEMRNLNFGVLQTDGLIFLWVTGRTMELGRELLILWGYKRVEEIVWVRTNHLQKFIRTKVHCLVGIKGDPKVNRNIDTDVIVSEVRETGRKPDEMYGMLERLSPRTIKLELFARRHNTRAGWVSLGDQLNGIRLVDEGLRRRFKAAYPGVVVLPPSPKRNQSVKYPDWWR